MLRTLFVILLKIAFFHRLSVGAERISSKTYTAGAVEFSSTWNYDLTPELQVEENLREYVKVMDEAASKNVDILVFPEATLNYHGLRDRQEMLDHAVVVPDERDFSSPCETPDGFSKTLTTLSCRTKQNRIYALVNLVEKEKCTTSTKKCPPDGHRLFNTNVVFDRQGRVVSKYRKFNLFLEPSMNVEETAKIAIFEMDGVKFGHFICFDILFKTPALDIIANNSVKHILYPSMWFSESPFLTATQAQQAWAYENNVVLIAAGANNPKKGSTGTGIYVGRHGALDLILAPERRRQLLVQQVPKDLESYHSRIINYNKRYTPAALDQVKLLEFQPSYTVGLTLNDETRRICKGKVCCEFSLKYKLQTIPSGKIGYTYRMTVFTGGRTYAGARTGGEIHCAIIACREDRHEACGKRFENSENLVPSVLFEDITIKAIVQIDNSENNYLIMPSTLDTTLLPYSPAIFNYYESSDEFIKKGKHYKNYTIATTKAIKDVLTFGIYGRNFNLDEYISHGSHSNLSAFSSAMMSNTFVWFTTLVVFFISYGCLK